MPDSKIITYTKPSIAVSTLDPHRIISRSGGRGPGTPPRTTPTRPDVVVGNRPPTDFSMNRQGSIVGSHGSVVGRPALTPGPKVPTVAAATVSGRASGGVGGVHRPIAGGAGGVVRRAPTVALDQAQAVLCAQLLTSYLAGFVGALSPGATAAQQLGKSTLEALTQLLPAPVPAGRSGTIATPVPAGRSGTIATPVPAGRVVPVAAAPALPATPAAPAQATAPAAAPTAPAPATPAAPGSQAIPAPTSTAGDPKPQK